MFTVRLRPDPGTDRAFRALIDHAQNGVNRIGVGERRMIADQVRRGFQDNFTRQRAGDGAPWAALALVTQAERRRKGFAGARPILVRTGEYRAALVNPNHPLHYSKHGPLVAGLYLEEGAEGRLVTYHEGGTRRMPARPATALGKAARERIGRTIDDVLQRVERRARL